MSRPRWSSARHLSRADSKLPSTLLAACMTSTSSRSRRSSGREPSGVFPTHSLPRSRNWIPSHSLRLQPSWVNFLKPGSHNRSSLMEPYRPTVPSQPVVPALSGLRGRGKLSSGCLTPDHLRGPGTRSERCAKDRRTAPINIPEARFRDLEHDLLP